ncbi:hypothetical protein [Streptomyces sediminimaris]|uniref:hypothetical protein n=1 Tax=Streptomyces sediminimaris TaxID=3383721 RepID=UPI00399C2D47
MSTPLERLLQEAIPVRLERTDGTHSLWTEQEQDRHWADLCDAVGAPNHRKHPPRKKAAA